MNQLILGSPQIDGLMKEKGISIRKIALKLNTPYQDVYRKIRGYAKMRPAEVERILSVIKEIEQEEYGN